MIGKQYFDGNVVARTTNIDLPENKSSSVEPPTGKNLISLDIVSSRWEENTCPLF
jgi:hypothetical protein